MLLVLTASTEILYFDFSAIRINYEIPILSSLKIRHYLKVVLFYQSVLQLFIIFYSKAEVRSISLVSTISHNTSPNAKASLIILQIDLSSS